MDGAFQSAVFRGLRIGERMFALAQGKGYGGNSIDAEVKAALKLLRRKPALVIDVGGNVGGYTLELLRKAPGAEVHVFEPSPVNLRKLRATFEHVPNVVVDEHALSSQEGSAVLYSDAPGSGLASLTRRDVSHVGLTFDAQEAIQTMRFETYWRGRLGCRPIDIVKLDVEGHEVDALLGFGDAFDVCSVVQFEFGGTALDTRVTWRDLFRLFTAREFDIFRITPFGLQPLPCYREIDEFYVTTNFLALSRRTAL